MKYHSPLNTIIDSPAYIAGSVPVGQTCLPDGRHQLQLDLQLMRSPILEIDVAANHVRAGSMLLRMTAIALGGTVGRRRYSDLEIEPVEQIVNISLHDVVHARQLEPICFEGTVGVSASSVPVLLVPRADGSRAPYNVLRLTSPVALTASGPQEDAQPAGDGADALTAHDLWVAATARTLALDIPAPGPASGFDAAMEEARRSVARELPEVAKRFRQRSRRRRRPSVEVSFEFEENRSAEVGAEPTPRARGTRSRTAGTPTNAAPTIRCASGIVTKWSKDGMVTCHVRFNGPVLGDVVTVPETCIVDYIDEDPETRWTRGGYTHRVRADYGM